MPLDEDVMVLPNTGINTIEVNSNDAVRYALEQRMEIRQKQITLEEDVFNIIRAKAENEFKGSISARIGLDALAGKIKNMYDSPTDNETNRYQPEYPDFRLGRQESPGEIQRIGDGVQSN